MSLQARLEALVASIGADIKERVTLSTAQVITGVKTFGDVVTPPSVNPTGGTTVYSEGGVLKVRQSNGVVAVTATTPVFQFSRSGVLPVITGTIGTPMPFAGTIESVYARINTPSGGASVVIDVKKNGVSIYGTPANRPTVAAGQNNAVVGAHSTTTFVAGDYITIDIVQVGSTTAGSDLGLTICTRRTG